MEPTQQGGKKNATMIVIIIVTAIAAIAVIALMINHGTPKSGGAAVKGQSGAAQQEPTAVAAPTSITTPAPTVPYASSEDSFTVNFPGAPTVTKTTFDSPTAGPIPLTEYKYSYASGSSTVYYALYVYHYPPSYVFPTTYLSGALVEFGTAMRQKNPAAAVIGQTSTQLAGNAALEATINSPVIVASGPIEDYIDYLVITMQGKDSYILNTYGVPQSEYTQFVGSFGLTQ